MNVTEDIEINLFIDDRNRDFVNEIRNNVDIRLQKIHASMPEGRSQLWGCRPNLQEATVFFYEDCDTTGYFTHELFHIDIIRNGFTNFHEVQNFVSENSHRQNLFQGIYGHIMNIFGHVKFYDRFLDMGYRPDEFVGDYHIHLDLNKIREQIDFRFDQEGSPNESVSAYIASYFSARDCHNPVKQGDYNQFLIELNNKDKQLYQILDDHWARWILSTSLNNLEIFSSMVLEVENWFRNR